MAKIKPGNFKDPAVDTDAHTPYPDFADSMAKEIEDQLNALLVHDGLTELSTAVTDREVRDRRRLFVAIARGVVVYLQQKAGAIDVELATGVIVHPVFNVEA